MSMHAVREGAELPELEREEPGQPSAKPLGPDPDAKGEAAVEAFARDHEGLTDEDERDALDFLLAPKPPRQYGVKVQYDTEAGSRPLTFVIRGMDGRRLDAIEQSHVSEATGKLDVISAEMQIVAEATLHLEDGSGRKVALDSQEFLTVRRPNPDNPDGFEQMRLASPADALEARFKTQLGLLSGVARQVRIISGYDPQRVGHAQRRLAGAVGKS
jgi:hypothetical protein